MIIHALMFNRQRLRGRCPACEGIMDVTGCRITYAGDIVKDPLNTGIRRVYTVDCLGEPTGPTLPCPCCASHPGEPCPDGD